MLTGDNRETALQVGRKLGIDDVVAEINPADKQAKVLELKSRGEVVAMAGATESTTLPLLLRLTSELLWEREQTLPCRALG